MFMAETDEILAETGNYKIEWNEAFGGTLYKANATLTSVEEGVTDIGWVFSFLEGAKLPLSQASTYAPFATNNPPVQLEVMADLLRPTTAFQQRMGTVQPQGSRADRHRQLRHLHQDADRRASPTLNGMKLRRRACSAHWLRGTGANAVDGALTTFYTDIQTGVSDGVLSLALGVLPAKLYEVAPYITRVNIGVAFSGAVAINKDSWDGLPEEVQNAMIEAGKYYTEAHGKDLLDRHEAALDEDGRARRRPDPAGDDHRDVRRPTARHGSTGCPNIAGEWAAAAESQGPARQGVPEGLHGRPARQAAKSRSATGTRDRLIRPGVIAMTPQHQKRRSGDGAPDPSRLGRAWAIARRRARRARHDADRRPDGDHLRRHRRAQPDRARRCRWSPNSAPCCW